MDISILQKLQNWRDETARKEGVEPFRVLPNRTIEEIAKAVPKTKEELTSIKGIKEKKFDKYGKIILGIISGKTKTHIIPPQNLFSMRAIRGNNDATVENNILSVSTFLDFLNNLLISNEVRVKGEVSSIDERERVVYFTLKDSENESVLNCLIFRYNYEMSGVKLEIGKEIVVDGYPEIYKPNGRLSLKASLIEITGEGALKKAYDELKNKLKKEGLFAPERKKTLKDLPQTIGLITSNQGAAIGDFMMNVGNYGFKIKFVNSSVEGKKALIDLVNAVKIINSIKTIDALVIIRGGGSLESLQAFNNETLVREICNCKVPVVCGVGHEKDISLVSLAADVSVSTPTAAARAIRESWDKAIQKMNHNQNSILSRFENYIFDAKYRVDDTSRSLKDNFSSILGRFHEAQRDLASDFEKIIFAINNQNISVARYKKSLIYNYSKMISLEKDRIKMFSSTIAANDPQRQLRLGYSIATLHGKIIRNVGQVNRNDVIIVKVSDGILNSKVEDITGN